LKKIIKSNPENVIRELLTIKYGTLDKACSNLNIGSRQALNNNLKRWSNQEGTFKAFYNILSQLNYKIEYYAFPIIPTEFDYDKFSKLLDDGKFTQASRLIDSAYSGNNQCLYTSEYKELRNQLENRKSYLENKYRIITSFSEEQLNSIIELNKSSEFSKNLEIVVDGYFQLKDIYSDLEKIIEYSDIIDEKEEIKKKFYNAFFGTIGREKKYFVEKMLVDNTAIWVKLGNNKIYDITNFFDGASLSKLNSKKKIEKLKVEYLSITDNTNTVSMVNCIYDGQVFLGEYDYVTEEMKQIKF